MTMFRKMLRTHPVLLAFLILAGTALMKEQKIISSGEFNGESERGTDLQSVQTDEQDGLQIRAPVTCLPCDGYPFGCLELETLLSGMEPEEDPFWKGLPKVFIRSGWIPLPPVAAVKDEEPPHVVKLFEYGAANRAVRVAVPFAADSPLHEGSVSISNRGTMSVGYCVYTPTGKVEFVQVFDVMNGDFRVMPSLSTNSCVRYGPTTNGTFKAKWNEVFLFGDPQKKCTFEGELYPDGTLVYRYFEGCTAAIAAACSVGVNMLGERWNANTLVGENREIRLRRVLSLEHERAARIPKLRLTEFEAWFYQLDPTLKYPIPPGWLLYFGLCPHRTNWDDVLPPDLVQFMADYPNATLADLIMKYAINPFEWTPDPTILWTTDPGTNPNHTLLTPGGNKVPVYITQTEPIAEDTLALLTVGPMRLQLSDTSAQSWTLYIAPDQTYTFSLRSLRDPSVKLSLSNKSPSGGTPNPPHVWVDDPDNVFGLGAFVVPGSRGGDGTAAFRVQSGGGGSRDGGTGGGKMATSTGKLVPVDPNNNPTHHVHGDTGWYTMEITSNGHTYTADNVNWSTSAWHLETNGNQARLIVSASGGDSSTATLIGIADLTGGLTGTFTATNTFYTCTNCDNSGQQPGIYFKSWSTNNLAPPAGETGAKQGEGQSDTTAENAERCVI